MSFISREAPKEAKGFAEANPPIITATAGIVKRYKTTIRSPANPLWGYKRFIQIIVEARTAAARPTKGERKKVREAACRGIMHSFPKSFARSAKF
jgi:hypothetical protein